MLTVGRHRSGGRITSNGWPSRIPFDIVMISIIARGPTYQRAQRARSERAIVIMGAQHVARFVLVAGLNPERKGNKKLFTLLDLCVSSLRRGHANLLCIVPILTDDPRRESDDTRSENGC